MADPFVVQRPWLAPLPGAPMNACRLLLCFPYGGGGASAFNGLSRLAEVGVATWAVKLPGREDRSMEAPVTRVAHVIEAILDALQSVGMPYAFYGHSFGAGLALDVTHALVERDRPLPTNLVLSGRMPPHTGYSPLLGAMDDNQLWQHVCSESLLPLPTDASCSFARHALGKLKADLALNAQLTYRFIRPLPVPLYVLNGQDDPLLELHRLDEWQRYTSKSFHSEYVPGGHFFFNINFQLLYLPLLTALDEQGS
ncbi:thioesterase [Pseudomonas syringae pv. tomato]|uniref:Thioesterase n=9 Tax=Pseudomonas syringae group TaxID=136849 RepID=A0A2K4X3X2_PSESX|nr:MULTISPECIES: alpha/beta fold hydrolase [Pseudomonas syringae group]AAQ93487.1 CmaT [Pseudomonas savastanoi pv. glycinea]AVB17591.1 thioesterase [Pseudomonas amygdali pv. morsprunorum]AVI87957.1 thioesterase [Pseudomonas syringae pv. tomato]EGH04401.1 coronamic acid synthetase, thioesterase component [Pseudomonas amygdali pv. aesculi str. 0893_23]KAA8706471.1 thioesterase [Pseudomonas cannabina]